MKLSLDAEIFKTWGKYFVLELIRNSKSNKERKPPLLTDL
jgi:hypothetical protein